MSGLPRRAEITVVYLAGLAQGLALVTFPAASTTLTDPKTFGLSSSAYGGLFIPFVVAAIAASGSSGPLARRHGLKRVFLGGLGCNAVAMTLLASSSAFTGAAAVAHAVLLLSTAFLGTGFGATLSALNTYAAGFFPEKGDAALTGLHALLGTGTALAPLFAAVSVRLGAWWALPLLVAVAMVALVAASFGQPLRSTIGQPRHVAVLRRGLGTRFRIYVAAVILYGACETLFGNWATIYLRDSVKLSLTGASVALAAFWAMVTVGRVAVAARAVRHPVYTIYVALPVLMIGSFLGVSRAGGVAAGLLSFAAAGLACSAFFPLSIDFAATEFPGRTETVSGGLVASYIAGYGIGAYGVGPLRDAAGMSLGGIYTGASAVALGLALLAYRIVRAPD